MMSSSPRAKGHVRRDDDANDQSLRSDSIKERNIKISSDKINTTWQSIGENSMSHIMDLLNECSDTVLEGIDGEERKREFEVTSNGILSRISSQLKNVPIPPKTREGAFSYEFNEEYKANLEALLLPLMEQISQLEGYIAKENRELEADKTYLKTMIEDFKKSEEFNPNSFKMAERLLSKYNNEKHDILDDPDSIGYEKSEEYNPNNNDERLSIALDSISQYVERLKGNNQGVIELLDNVDNVMDVLGPGWGEIEEGEEEGEEQGEMVEIGGLQEDDD